MPYMQVAKTNKKLLESEYKEYIKDIVVDRMYKLMTTPWNISYDLIKSMENVKKWFNEQHYDKVPNLLLYHNYVDVVRLFVKNEPHTTAKIESGRYRLISSVSLVDQIIERLLHSAINEMEIMKWEMIPSCPGIGLTTDRDFYKLTYKFADKSTRTQTDVSAWDWSVQYWELIADAMIRIRQYSHHIDTSMLERAILNRAFLTSETIYCFSDGEMIVLPEDSGIQLSGSYLTSAGNSKMRILAHVLVHGEYCGAIAMGDDCIDTYHPDIYNKYAQLGHPLKFAEKCSHLIDFCSHTIEVDYKDRYVRHYPNNLGKQLFNLLNQPKHSVNAETFRQFMDPYRYHPERDVLYNGLCKDAVWGDLARQYVFPYDKHSTFRSYNNDRLDSYQMTRKGQQTTTGNFLGTKETITTTKKLNPKKHSSKHPKSKKTSELVMNGGKPKKVVEHVTNYVYPKVDSGLVPINHSRHIGQEKFSVKNIPYGIRISGSSLISEALSRSPLAHICANIPLHPNCFNSWQLSKIATNYQKFLFRKVHVQLVSQLPTTTSGLTFAACLSSNETIPALTGLGLKKFLQSNPTFNETNCFNSVSTYMQDSKFLPSYNMLVQDYTTSIQGAIILGCSNIATGTYLGDVIVKYEVDLYNMTSPNVNVTQGSDQVFAPDGINPTTWRYFYAASGTAPIIAAYNYWSRYPGIWQATLVSTPSATFFENPVLIGSTVFISIVVLLDAVEIYICPTYEAARGNRAYNKSSGSIGAQSISGYYLYQPSGATNVDVNTPLCLQETTISSTQHEEDQYKTESEIVPTPVVQDTTPTPQVGDIGQWIYVRHQV